MTASGSQRGRAVTLGIDPGPLDRAFDHAFAHLAHNGFVDALWTRHPDVWTTDPAVRRVIANRLGWLHATETMRPHVARLRALGEAIRRSEISDVVLLGMGGSSLAAETLRTVVGVAAGYPRFYVLDSIDPDAVRVTMERAATSLFLVASKSGSTIEVAALTAEAERRVRAAATDDPHSHFVAITDEHTPLHRRALEERFGDLFLNPGDVGGRFSAVTFFGLVPAALMGIDVDALLSSAEKMADACRQPDPRGNPGVALGAMLATAATSGRDKLMLRMPPDLAPLGLWIEQLIAESTGKDGKGIVPIVGEADDSVEGDDRIVVEILSGESALPPLQARRNTPHVRLSFDGLGAEFLRWEIAAATAGFLLGVNPFDEPNVQQAKDATRALLDRYTVERRLPVPAAHFTIDEVPIALTGAAASDAPGGSPLLPRLLRRGDYFGLLAYVPSDDVRLGPVLGQFRAAVAAKTGCATMLGFGPRYLHSTGQLHKGGPNTGVFAIVTADATDDLAVPGQPYSFGVLERAQAIGDFQALDRLGRRAVLLHLPRRDPVLLQHVIDVVLGR